MLHIGDEKELKFDKQYLMVDSKRERVILRLNLIDHIKYEKNYGGKLKSSINNDMMVLYNKDHVVLHKLVFEQRDLGSKTYYALCQIIKERGLDDHERGEKK